MRKWWPLSSATLVLCLYFLSGLLAERWWLSLDGDASIWGMSVSKLPLRHDFYAEPIVMAVAAAAPAMLACSLSRRLVVGLAQLGIASALAINDTWYALKGVYFGCDVHGCSSEEGYFLVHAAAVPLSLLCWLLIAICAWVASVIVDAVRRRWGSLGEA